MIAPSARPKLASKAMLRRDKQTGKDVLLYPEKGLVLNATGAAILRLCTGERDYQSIVLELSASFGESAPAALEGEVESFLRTLAERGLVEGLEP
jgi:coenzyme PQQ biosynthesis protein PqqD